MNDDLEPAVFLAHGQDHVAADKLLGHQIQCTAIKDVLIEIDILQVKLGGHGFGNLLFFGQA